MASRSKPPPPRKDRLGRPWVPGDSIPLPEVVQKDSESVWALWSEANRQDPRFAPTAPMKEPGALGAEQRSWAPTEAEDKQAPPLPRGAAAPQALFTLESALLLARRNNRVCPRPDCWTAFHALLPVRKTMRGTLRPPVPVTGDAWNVTPPLTKRLIFREQLEWAEREGVLEQAMAFLHRMEEQDWLHMGED